MRIKLKKGKQMELILLAKANFTWKDLGRKLKMNDHYISNELKKENRLLSEKNYKRLCEINGVNFDQYIEKRLDDEWGKSKGGTNNKGNLKEFKDPEKNKELAELIGVILGDGHLEYYTKSKGIGSYSLIKKKSTSF